MEMTRLGMTALAGIMLALGGQANAASVNVYFGGSGVSGALTLTYGPGTDAKYPNAYEVTGITGIFSDSNIGISNAIVSGAVPITHDTPEPSNLLAPNDFSRFAVASGLPADSHGFLTFDNLFWPGGSPPTASDYPIGGGFLDIYGLMFEIGGGNVVDFWSNGGGQGYGVAVATAETALDYVGGVAAGTPESSTWAMMALGFSALGFVGFRRSLSSKALAS